MFMRNSNRVGAIGIAVLLAAVTVVPALAAGDMTVGLFVQKLAEAQHLNAADSRR